MWDVRFIKPKQSSRESSVRVKLNVLKEAVDGKRIIMIDDSICARNHIRPHCKNAAGCRSDGGARPHQLAAVFVAVLFWYGHSEREQLIAYNRTIEEIRDHHRSRFSRLSRN